MTTLEEEAYLSHETEKNLALLQSPGSRIHSEASGNERLVIGEHNTTFLLTVRTNPDETQVFEPVLSGKLPKIARVIAEGRKYRVVPFEQSEKKIYPTLTENDFKVGSFIISESGTARMIIDVQGDDITTITKKNDSFAHDTRNLHSTFLNPDKNKWIYAVLPPTDSTFLLEAFLSKQHITILGDTSEKELKKTLELFQTKSGHQIVAGCDVGYQEGTDAQKPNQDRVVVDPKRERYAVIDGLGGKPDGHVVAQLLAEEIATSEVSIPETINKARERLREAAIINDNLEIAGATFVSAEVIREHGKIYIEENHLGDANLLILDENGTVVHRSEVDAWAERIVAAQYPNRSVEENAREASRHPQRAILTKSFSIQEEKPDPPKRTEVKPGYRVLLMSDGISDTLLPEEIAKLIKGKTPLQAMQVISDVTTKRFTMRKTLRTEQPDDDTNYSDGYYQKPKPDNRGLVVFDVEW